MNYEKKSEVQDISEDFGLSNWKDEIAIYNIGEIVGNCREIVGKADLRENLRSSVLIMVS